VQKTSYVTGYSTLDPLAVGKRPSDVAAFCQARREQIEMIAGLIDTGYSNPCFPGSRFKGATAFWEMPDKSPMGAFACVTDSNGVTWALNEDPPRPVSEPELRAKGAFRCKPEDAVEAKWWPLNRSEKRGWRSPANSFFRGCY